MTPYVTQDGFDPEFLAEAQSSNLAWCERWLASLPDVRGVKAGLGMTYDLVQLLNAAAVEEMLRIARTIGPQDSRTAVMMEEIADS